MTAELTQRQGWGSEKPKSVLVSFSGIDGAGKTTQINNLVAWLGDAGLSVRLINFWDDVAALKPLRERVGHAVFRGEKGVGAPGKPVKRRDKNICAWYMLPVRLWLCLLDTLSLGLVVSKIRQRPDADVVVFDRYIYDQLANLDMSSRVARIYLWLLHRLVYHPDIAYLLDADPVLARDRKPEYPIEFLHYNRASYLALSDLVGMNVIPSGTPEEVETEVRRNMIRMLGRFPGRPTVDVLTSSQG